MIKSMTGFGRAELKDDEKSILVEIRTVNNKYLKINTKIPDSFQRVEDRIEKLLKKELFRGTVNLTLDYKTAEQESKCFINKELLVEYHNAINEIRKDISPEQDISLERLISLPGVIEFKKETENGNVSTTYGRNWTN